MRFLALEHESSAPTPPDLDALLRDEARAVWQLYRSGLMRDLWFTTPGRRAVILLECRSAAAARRHLATLPLVRHGLIHFTVLGLRPYDGFARLFVRHSPETNP